MAEVGRNNQVGIPSGLNRIKTHRVSSKDHLNSKPDELTESRSCSVSKPPQNQKQRPIHGDGKFTNYSKEDIQKGKKMAGWFTSYISKFNNGPPNFEECTSGIRTFVKEGPKEFKSNHDGSHQNDDQLSTELLNCSKVSKGLKSFSHELGPKGGVPSAYPRAHSYSNLKELLETLHSKFETAKQVVNSELTSFARDVMDILEKTDSSFSEGKKMVEDLLILARECVEMSPSLFRVKCEIIVQDLTEKRQQCQVGLVKWLFSRMLFILTRCTRLLMFQKESQPIDEKSLQKFKKCLESVPSVESNWVPNPEMTNSDVNYALNQKSDSKTKVSAVAKQKLPSQDSEQRSCLQDQQLNQVDGRFPGKSVNNSSSVSLHGQEQALDGSNLVICRICEEIVPISYLESHSYICAYADKCELNCLDIDERLSKLAEILEQITESRNLSFHPPVGSPEHSKMLATNLSVTSEGYSPKISEWRNKGVEGMFEDIHEMDTASIDDSHLSSINLKGHLGVKLSSYGASSSTGSMTSVSSTNTPRAGHFDAFWLERNSPSELEDVQQMIELADVARCVADTDHAEEGSCEFLLACMQDLQDILQNSKLKALVIDTFGSRIENLLREKYILACEAQDVKVPTIINKMWETYRLPSDNASQSSAVSSPLNSSHKERTSIDDFEIIKPISRGAFGKVFLARKRTTGDLFAIKVLKKLDMLRKNDIERILAERNILITVRNPFVVRFFYSFTCRENLYLVMEYLNGGDLYSLLRKVGCLEEDVARIYIAELVLALEYLHSLAIVHRDLKPDNILIAHDGHIKLTDFGLSKIGLINNTVDLSGAETNGTLSSDSHNQDDDQHTGDRNQQSAVGTPDYLAPEILLGTEHGYAADWWSVGIILFELITGIPPFSAESPEIIFDNILNRKLPWPQVPEDMSFEAQDLIDRLLIHDPDKRLGANGAAEVKAHAFFRGVNWDNLALQKAAFVPQPESHDDTSYFLSRFSQISNGIPDDHNSSDSDSDGRDSSSQFEDQVDECGEMEKFNTPLDLSLINFSFKNLSQLASINHDVLLQNGKDSAKTNPL